ncbi:Hypothetical predicted protein, partial [Marmota monax]
RGKEGGREEGEEREGREGEERGGGTREGSEAEGGDLTAQPACVTASEQRRASWGEQDEFEGEDRCELGSPEALLVHRPSLPLFSPSFSLCPHLSPGNPRFCQRKE